MKKYIITTNRREVEWSHLTAKLARADFYNKEILPQVPVLNGGGTSHQREVIKSVKRKRTRLKQLTIFDDPTYHE